MALLHMWHSFDLMCPRTVAPQTLPRVSGLIQYGNLGIGSEIHVKILVWQVFAGLGLFDLD